MENHSEALSAVLNKIAQQEAERSDVAIKSANLHSRMEGIVRRNGRDINKGVSRSRRDYEHFLADISTQIQGKPIVLRLSGVFEGRKNKSEISIQWRREEDSLGITLFEFFPNMVWDHNLDRVRDVVGLERVEAVVNFVEAVATSSASSAV